MQPSVSLVLAQIGRLDALCAVTKYCVDVVPELAAMGLPVLHDSWSFDKAGEVERLAELRPDLVIASVPYRMESLAAILKAGLPLLALAPRGMADVYGDIRLIARAVEAGDVAEERIAVMEARIAGIELRAAGLETKTVYCEEWGKPLIHSQGWVAELVTAANGRFVGIPGGHTTAEAVAAEDPDVLLFAWCGVGDRVPLERLVAQRGWEEMRAVREGRVFCVPDEFFNTPAFNLVEGLEAIAGAVHPEAFLGHPRVRKIAR